MKLFKTHKKGIKNTLLALLFVPICLQHQNLYAQLKPVNAVYFFNEYLINPAMAGRTSTLNATVGFRKQGNLGEATPSTQYLSADYGLSPKSGIGIILYNDKAGLFRQTTAAATYAHHMSLNETSKLHFGLSATFSANSLDYNLVAGDVNDPDIINVNRRKTYFDSDFGVAYTTNNLSVQASVPNLVTVFRNNRANETNYALFFTSLSYKFDTDFLIIEPKTMLRGVKGFKSIFDVGSNFTFQSDMPNKVNIMALYHSTNNATLGFGISQDDSFNFNISYTLGTSQMRPNTNGDLEIGFTLKIK